MRSKLTKFALAAAFGLALTFTFSCSSDDGGGGGNDNVSYYHPDSEYNRCQNGVVESKCGDEWYNGAKYACWSDRDEFSNIYYTLITLKQYYEKLEQLGYVRCGNSYYHPDYTENARCRGGVLEYECNEDEWYNTAKYACASDRDEYSNIYHYLITLEQWYEQNGYVRCK